MGAAVEPSTGNALIFDIETIADLRPETHDAVAALAAERDMTPEHFGALCPPLARVVCIGWLDLHAGALGVFYDGQLGGVDRPASILVDDAHCALRACDGEAEILRAFGRLVEAHCRQPHAPLVTYNGRGFDLPVLVHRSLIHGVTAGRTVLVNAVRENRYAPLLHVDLMDSVTFYGAGSRWPMAAYAIAYGGRSPKGEMRGADVGTAARGGRILDVARYCAGDVLATAAIYRAAGELVLQRGAR